MREQTPDCLIDRSAAERVQRDQACVLRVHDNALGARTVRVGLLVVHWWAQRRAGGCSGVARCL